MADIAEQVKQLDDAIARLRERHSLAETDDVRVFDTTLVIEDAGNPRARKDENRAITFIGTTETVDRHGSIIKADGIDFSRYRQNPVVLLDHMNWTDGIAGQASKIEPITEPAKGFRITVEFASKESEQAAQAERMARAGFLRGMSIGFIPKRERWGDDISVAERDLLGLPRNGYIVEEAEVLEFSLVAIGSNPDALQRALRDKAIRQEDVDMLSEPEPEPATAASETDTAIIRNLLERLVLGQSEAMDNFEELVSALREAHGQELQAVVAAIARLTEKVDALSSDDRRVSLVNAMEAATRQIKGATQRRSAAARTTV